MSTPIPTNEAELTTWSAAAATGGSIARTAGDGARAVGVTSDSRAVRPGCAFVALRGATHDGHEYLQNATNAGAALLVVARDHGRAIPGGPDVVEVDDTLAAWGELAAAHLRAWRRHASRTDPARVIAITGSAGKTTTKELCAALLGAAAPTHATAGNLNNRVGVPAVIFGITRQHRFAVLEMGMNVRGEIEALARVARPDVAIVTNVGVAHAEGVGGSRADVAREKGALYAALDERAAAIVNVDDAAAAGQLARCRTERVIGFGRGADAAYRLIEREPLGEHGSRLVIDRGARVVPLAATLPIVGEAAAIDFVAAVAAFEVATGWTLTTGVVREALESLRAPDGRAAVRTLGDVVVLDDTYNANPGSVRAALATLAELAASRGSEARSVVVLGEMKELGARAQEEHEAIGDAIADAKVALAISCGGLADAAVDRAATRGVEAVRASDAKSAASEAVARVRPGDVVLVKGSRSVGAEAVVAALAAALARGRDEGSP